jgi:hypothetical protein
MILRSAVSFPPDSDVTLPEAIKAFTDVLYQRIDVAGPQDRGDIAIEAHQHPIPGRYVIRLAEVTALIDEIAT